VLVAPGYEPGEAVRKSSPDSCIRQVVTRREAHGICHDLTRHNVGRIPDAPPWQKHARRSEEVGRDAFAEAREWYNRNKEFLLPE
jgi:hypothetical protein